MCIAGEMLEMDALHCTCPSVLVITGVEPVADVPFKSQLVVVGIKAVSSGPRTMRKLEGEVIAMIILNLIPVGTLIRLCVVVPVPIDPGESNTAVE